MTTDRSANRPQSAPEHAVVSAIRLAASDLGIVLWINSTGMIQNGPRKFAYGLCVGSSDLIGILRPEGVFVAIECKAKTKVTKEQQKFLDLVRASGGVACVARNVGDVRQAIGEWRARR